MWEHTLAFNKQGPWDKEAQHGVISNPVLEHAVHEMFCFPLSQERVSHALRFPWYFYQQEEQRHY